MKIYEDALARLASGKPKIVPKGTKITNDSVSLEAGLGKGSIKKSRPQFEPLIAQIRSAAQKQKKSPEADLSQKVRTAQDTSVRYRDLYEAALAREMSLAQELFRVKRKLAELTGEKIIPILQKKIP